MRGLTSLFGMGRGEHPRQNHHKILKDLLSLSACRFFPDLFSDISSITSTLSQRNNLHIGKLIIHLQNKIKAYGQLVLLGFDVTTLTPVAYQRRSLRRPLKVNSS